NRTLTSRRSAFAGGPAPASGRASVDASVRRVPQLEQNLLPGATTVPQLGHVALSGIPHSRQNFAAASLWVPHWEQSIGRSMAAAVRIGQRSDGLGCWSCTG